MSEIGKLQTWKIPADKLHNWRRLNPDIPKNEATDCVINSLHYLGVIENPDFAGILSNYANTNKRGITDSEVLELIFKKFNEDNDYKIINHKIGSKTEIELKKELKNDNYTFAFYRRSTGMWHGVIVTKQNNIIYVLDPQQEKIFCEFTNYLDWVKEQQFVRVDYILKSKIARRRNETTVKLRKNTVSEHTRKRRKIGVTSSNSSSKKGNMIQKILPIKKTSSKKTSTSTLTSSSKKLNKNQKILPIKKTSSKNTSTSTLTSSSKKENILENVVQKLLPKKKTNSKNSSLSTTKKANMVKKVQKKRKRTQTRHGSNSSSKKDNMIISI